MAVNMWRSQCRRNDKLYSDELKGGEGHEGAADALWGMYWKAWARRGVREPGTAFKKATLE